jgi:hypothetical protein
MRTLSLSAFVLALALVLATPSAYSQTEIARFDGWAAGDQHAVVISAGDIDLDGFDDLIVGAPLSSTGAPEGGSVYAYSGADGSVIWQVDHAKQGAHYGWSLARGGTTFSANGDLFVGAPYEPTSGMWRPGAVFYLDISTGSLIGARFGVQDQEAFGWSVAAADLGHTGLVWPIFGAPFSDANGADSGYVGMFAGGSLTTIPGLPGDRFGYSLASGHFDIAGADPYLDLIVGAPGYDGPGTDRGIVHVYEATNFLVSFPVGDADGDQFGSSVGVVALAAGYDGYLVGAPFDDDAGTDAGRVRCFGKGIEVGTWTGTGAGDEFGSALAGVGDLDGDGCADWVASAAQPLGPGTGYVRALLGQSGLELWTVSGAAVSDDFGWHVADAGDLNGDGVPDVAVGAVVAANAMGRVRVFSGRCGDVLSYCTAGTSATGCAPVLSATGQPSASAASGFLVQATSVEGARDGLFFYGTNGRQANSWGNGSSYQCVVPPVKRAGLLSGNGSAGTCSGQLSQDLNTLWQANPLKNPGAQVVQLQCWYRDPFNTSNQTTSLSNAIEFIVCP